MPSVVASFLKQPKPGFRVAVCHCPGATQVLGLWGHDPQPHSLHCSPSLLRVGPWDDPLAPLQTNWDRFSEPSWLHHCPTTLTQGETLEHCGSWNPERKKCENKRTMTRTPTTPWTPSLEQSGAPNWWRLTSFTPSSQLNPVLSCTITTLLLCPLSLLTSFTSLHSQLPPTPA